MIEDAFVVFQTAGWGSHLATLPRLIFDYLSIKVFVFLVLQIGSLFSLFVLVNSFQTSCITSVARDWKSNDCIVVYS